VAGVAVLVLSLAPALAERIPADGARLTRTHLLFELDPIPGAEGYLVQVGDDEAAEPFAHPLLELRTATLTARSESFRFGRSYRWRYAALDAAGRPGDFGGSFQFSILTSPLVDRGRFRVRVRGPERPPGVILLDHARVAVNGEGHPVWFLPENEELFPARALVRDLKLSPAGSLTLLTRDNALELDLDGAVRWRAPRIATPGPGERGMYHHDLKRLANGHYMVLYFEVVPRQVPGEAEPRELHYDGIVEFDREGRTLWTWSARDYVSDADIFGRERVRGMHMNAFDADPGGRYVYGGFRDLSRIVKIDRESGAVVDSWGDRMPSGEARSGQGLFANQHDCVLAGDGTIVVYNNNRATDEEAPSGIVRFRPGSKGGEAKVVWRWEVPESEGLARKARAGGSVVLLPGDEGYLLNMGAVNHLFVVSPEGRVRWEALVESLTPATKSAPAPATAETDVQALPYLAGGSWAAGGVGSGTPGAWDPFPQYRASWASSLWPIWFTLEKRPGADGSAALVRVRNEGSEPDTYVVVDADGESTPTRRVDPGAWLDLPVDSGNGSVTVRSTADPDRIRSIAFPVPDRARD